jgi:DNA-binding CsgD family transcriptional regulator
MTRQRPTAASARTERPGDVGAALVTASAGVQLTDRELAVLDLAADGLITAAIARRLGISPRTVGKHLEQAYRKLGANDRVSAVLRAHSLGLVPFPAEPDVITPAAAVPEPARW